MIRKVVIMLLALGGVGSCTSWAFQRGDLTLVPMQETEAARMENHFVVFVHGGGLNIEYGPTTWLTRPTQYFARFAGWGYAHHRTASQEYRGFLIPHWALLLLLASYPALAFARGPLRRWRRKRNGLCVKCGYELTGNVTGVCSECGTKIDKP